MNLIDLRVVSQKVGLVIKEVGELCGKILNQFLSRIIVDVIVDRKLLVVKKQILQILLNKDCIILYIDEIRKYGKMIMQSYIVIDENQILYVIGLRDMLNKSGKCILDIF